METNGDTRRAMTTPAPPAPVPGHRPFGTFVVAAEDPDMRLYMRHGVAGLASEVVEAADGLEALEQIRDRRVALVIAEARMPRLDGLELAQLLADRGEAVLLVGEVPLGEARQAGASAVLERPFDRRQLRLRVREALAMPRVGALSAYPRSVNE